MDYKPNEFVNAFLLQSFQHPKGAKKALGNERVTDFIDVAVQRLARANAIFIGTQQMKSMLLQMVEELDLEDDFPKEGLEVSIEDIIPPEHKGLFELQIRENDEPEDQDDPLFPWDGFKQVLYEAHGNLEAHLIQSDNYDYRLVALESDSRRALQRMRLIRLNGKGEQNAAS